MRSAQRRTARAPCGLQVLAPAHGAGGLLCEAVRSGDERLVALLLRGGANVWLLVFIGLSFFHSSSLPSLCFFSFSLFILRHLTTHTAFV